MTDNEIIKAWEEHYINKGDRVLIKNTLDLINRQKAEVEKKDIEIDILIRKKETLKDEISELMAEIERLQNESIGNCEMAISMRDNHNLNVDCNYCLVQPMEEFWIKLRNYAVVMGCYHIVEYGDGILKEMEGK